MVVKWLDVPEDTVVMENSCCHNDLKTVSSQLDVFPKLPHDAHCTALHELLEGGKELGQYFELHEWNICSHDINLSLQGTGSPLDRTETAKKAKACNRSVVLAVKGSM